MNSLVVEPTISMHSIIVMGKDLVSADLAGEEVILNLKSGMYYGLDSVGARIWSLIQAPRRVNDIRDTLIQEYEVEPDRCECDLLALLRNLAAEELIEVKGEVDE